MDLRGRRYTPAWRPTYKLVYHLMYDERDGYTSVLKVRKKNHVTDFHGLFYGRGRSSCSSGQPQRKDEDIVKPEISLFLYLHVNPPYPISVPLLPICVSMPINVPFLSYPSDQLGLPSPTIVSCTDVPSAPGTVPALQVPRATALLSLPKAR